MFKRPHFQNLIGRIKEPKSFIQVITWPRQVGKPLFQSALVINTFFGNSRTFRSDMLKTNSSKI